MRIVWQNTWSILHGDVKLNEEIIDLGICSILFNLGVIAILQLNIDIKKTVGGQIHAFPITATRVYTRKFQLSITARGTFWSQLHLQDARSDATASDLELISGGCHCTFRLSISRWSSQGNDITSDSPSLVRISKKLHSQSILTRWK